MPNRRRAINRMPLRPPGDKPTTTPREVDKFAEKCRLWGRQSRAYAIPPGIFPLSRTSNPVMLRRIRILISMVSNPRALREAARWSADRHRGQMRPLYETRRDLQRIPMGDDARLEVFWKDLEIGRGPAVSVFVCDEEILRIDCFGPGSGHMHAAFFLPAEGEDRLFLPEPTIREQIRRAEFEIARNLEYYRCRVSNPAIRDLTLDADRIADAAAEAGRVMTAFIDEVPELSGG
jgi:hypothetical protein